MKSSWFENAVFYHIYPLGYCGAPERNDFNSAPCNRLNEIGERIDYIASLGCNAVYLGPVFESSAHGYDTADYFNVDRRLGSNADLAGLIESFHSHGIRVVLDGVFNHVGRSFWAFRDVQEKLETSQFCGWFSSLKFGEKSPCGDPFTYEGWNGHYELVRLNLGNNDVRNHLLAAVRMWITDFGIDGIRLDAADCVDIEFQKELSAYTKQIKKEFFLLGEVIHGNYNNWVNQETLDSVTNYECFKGLYSSCNDRNFFEIAYSLRRQFGSSGIYRGLPMYSFADNHDVNRVASLLTVKDHLLPLYSILFTMPGVPSVYYGSEWGIEGVKSGGSDKGLRPCINDLENAGCKSGELQNAISKLASLRRSYAALGYGSYEQLHVSHEQFAFLRQYGDEQFITVVNSSSENMPIEIGASCLRYRHYRDLLNGGEVFSADGGKLKITSLPPCSGRILLGI